MEDEENLNYKCEKSGLTDSQILMYHMYDISSERGEEITPEQIRKSNLSGFGENFGQVRNYMERHIMGCQGCQKVIKEDESLSNLLESVLPLVSDSAKIAGRSIVKMYGFENN
jgi:hypothetical protein